MAEPENEPPRLNLTFVVQGKKTRTRIGLSKSINRMRFQNDDDRRTLTVKFVPVEKIEQVSGPPMQKDTLKLKADECATFKFKGNGKGNPEPMVGDNVRYTAQFEGAEPEDPIVIIE